MVAWAADGVDDVVARVDRVVGLQAPVAMRRKPARSSARQDATLPVATGTMTSSASGWSGQPAATKLEIMPAPSRRPRKVGSPMS